MPLYSTPSTSRQYPDNYRVPVVGHGVRVAFLPRNEDAINALLDLRMPRMTVHPKSGKPVLPGKAFGLLWLPPVDEVFSCAGFEWEDGSSAIDPPPEILEKLS